jgi:hypothetical protein
LNLQPAVLETAALPFELLAYRTGNNRSRLIRLARLAKLT